jgi:histidinol-phosphate aminotransferase
MARPQSGAQGGHLDRPQSLAGLETISPYVPGDAQVDGKGDVIKLSSNENALGASPRAREAYLAAASRLEIYPDGGSTKLREAIAAQFQIEADRIVCGAGSDELLQLIGRGYVAPGDEVLYSQYGFSVYPLIAKQCRATGVAAPEKNLTADVDALLACVSEKTKVVFIANPNNPTGTLLPTAEVERLQAGLPPTTLLVLDAAYAEFVDDPAFDGGLALARTKPNVVMTRTFSKIYGLAGVRIGWMYGAPEVVDIVHKLRSPFNLSVPALAAGVAAVKDQAFVRATVAHNLKEKARLEGAAEQLGILAVRGVCNFVLLRFGSEPGKTAKDADAFLRARGIIIRGMTVYGLPDCLRATVGRTEDNDRLIAALQDFVGVQSSWA